MRAIVEDIFHREMGIRPQVDLLAGGIVNAVYAATHPDANFVIRLKSDYLQVYRKEEWAMAQADLAGIPVPKVHAVGQHDEHAYMIVEKIDGVSGVDYQGDMLALHREIGRLARQLNSIPVNGYGFTLDLATTPIFSESWQDIVAADHQNFFGDDRLTRLGILTKDEKRRAEKFLEPLRDWRHPPFLSHNDLGIHNVMVDRHDKVHLIDWTLAQGQPAPYFDIGNFAVWTRDARLDVFVAGYGLTSDEWDAMKTEVDRVSFATALRATLWSEKEAPHKLHDFTNVTRGLAAEMLFETGKALETRHDYRGPV